MSRRAKSKAKLSPKDNPNAFKSLKELPFFEVIDTKIKQNVAVEELARWIQEDKLQMQDLKRESLVRQLHRYKAALPPGEVAEVEPLFFAKSIEKLNRGVDEIAELEKLYLYQLKRISMDGETEEKINKLFGGMNREIQLAADLLSKMIDKKMELGLMSREPQQLNVAGTVGTLDLTAPNIEVDEEMRTKMGMVAGKLVDTMAKMYSSKPEAGKDKDCSEEPPA